MQDGIPEELTILNSSNIPGGTDELQGPVQSQEMKKVARIALSWLGALQVN